MLTKDEFAEIKFIIKSSSNMQRTPRTSRTVAENKSRDTILKDEKKYDLR